MSGDVDPSTPLEVTLLVRPRQALEQLDTAIAAQQVLSREEYAASYGADPAELAQIEAFARSHGVQVVESSQARRSVVLRGTSASLGKAFGVHLHLYRDASGQAYRAPDGPVSIPSELAGIVESVFGFDDRPAAHR